MLLYNYALPISTALLNVHLIEPKDGLFALEKAAVVADTPAFRGDQCRGPTG